MTKIHLDTSWFERMLQKTQRSPNRITSHGNLECIYLRNNGTNALPFSLGPNRERQSETEYEVWHINYEDSSHLLWIVFGYMGSSLCRCAFAWKWCLQLSQPWVFSPVFWWNNWCLWVNQHNNDVFFLDVFFFFIRRSLLHIVVDLPAQYCWGILCDAFLRHLYLVDSLHILRIEIF